MYAGEAVRGVMAFLGFVVMTSVRINLSVALVAMVRQNASNAVMAETQCRGNESLTMLRQEDSGNRTLVTPWSAPSSGGGRGDNPGIMHSTPVYQGGVFDGGSVAAGIEEVGGKGEKSGKAVAVEEAEKPEAV
ncbi:hypothetical protein GWK47_015259 [Chionoecetes opilio]|uniref:Uncharacterized protein n=1 Tax=Chionoecetes opilio TaxID=41210 RepID=A0A8J4XVA9_CHIOP|nr:hypothetical protein GWK47_015259 [Chionoecetes opilio]KAG0713862.1 hypothetical protein GWK47_015259 [Chionoecetes opilio]